jgi:DNA-binding winged helix-turn-helix (wHTH) protein
MRLRFADCVVDTDQRQVFRGDHGVALSSKAYQLLVLLLEARPKALAKEKLYLELWPDTFVVPANLANLIGEIRAALGDSASSPRFIRTLHGFGYAFAAGVEVEEPRPVTAENLLPHWIMWSGMTFPLRTGENIIGRAPTIQICIDESGVSRRHARIVIEAEGATLEDLGSKNGTFVNGERIGTPRKLVSGDELHLGSVDVTFHSASEGLSTLTAAHPPGRRTREGSA